MEVRRGIDPIRFYLVSEGRDVGAISATVNGLLVARFHGFPTAALAERAGWLARHARQSDAASRRANPAGTFLLSRSDDVARVEPDPERGTWSLAMTLAAVGTPDVFTLARARRMWEAIRRAGLGRQMVQWNPQSGQLSRTVTAE